MYTIIFFIFQSLLKQSEYEKEKALMMQKLQHYERTLDEFNKKDKDALAEEDNLIDLYRGALNIQYNNF